MLTGMTHAFRTSWAATRAAGRPVVPSLPVLQSRIVQFALLVLCVQLIARHHHPLLVGAACAGLLVIRGVALRRPVTVRHLESAVVLLTVSLAAAWVHHPVFGQVGLALGAFVLCLPVPPPPAASADERAAAARLLDASAGDALAPFALRADKALVFAPSGGAAVGFRVRCGIAVASGDPIGAEGERWSAVAAFLDTAARNGWRPAVLGAGPAASAEWRAAGLRGLAFGNDVVIDVSGFTMSGREFRNVRQAVHRATNAGMTTEVIAESDIDDELRAELEGLVAADKKSTARGFSMMLGGLLDGTHRHTLLVIGRDRDGRVVAFQRYGIAGRGTDLALDVPWRRPDAQINGMDERLVAAVVEWGRTHGVRRVSLAFAPFPGLFADHRGPLRSAGYAMARAMDGFIRLESLYRFLRKFHAFGPTRSILFRPLALVPVLLAVLLLEFSGG